MAEIITARKGNQEKKFTKYAFELMGPNTGWVQVGETSHPVVNEVPMPETGQKKVNNHAVVNEAPKKSDQPVVNEADKPKEPTTGNSSGADFRNVVKKNLTVGVIKDYLDIKSIKYKQSDRESTLHDKLYGHFKGDVESLKKEFGL